MACLISAEPFGLITRGDLRRCIDEGQLQLHYQPIIDLVGGAVSGVEAVLRWRHPDLGWSSPHDFLALVEASDLTHHLGFWVLDTASLQIARWRAQGANWSLSACTSLQQLQYLPYRNGLQRMFVNQRLHPRQLTLVFSASELPDGARSFRQLSGLSSLAVEFSLAILNTGSVDPLWLQSLPVKEIKLAPRGQTPRSACPAATVTPASLLKAAHGRRLRVVGMNVDTGREFRTSQELGLDLAQGDFVCPPMAADAVFARLSRMGAIAGLPGP
ncbi:EAL domain-containing protein [Stenotrophomonas sp. NA06056]|uniref:EAL domain-containing protein n=1 Tax=Stenotrophomonas sp. NA06056 TaxID=2742129 RepID=UPI00158C50C9|nr:EAL domain-containing protein [Stenotrophomonas sp. NA06056]QKW56785.1 EAL domain-containing protein [Stenotrophomonas sp. NA06056]